MRIKFFLIIVAMACQWAAFAQHMRKPSAAEIRTLPEWAQAMYAESPNVFVVDSLYRAHFAVHPFQKSYHTQYYKRWRKAIAQHIDARGYVVMPTLQELQQSDALYRQQRAAKGSGTETNPTWTPVGPYQTYNDATTPANEQTNVYSIDQCAGAPQVLYCGTEPGEVYKSTDSAATWTCVSLNDDFNGGVSAIEVSPAQPDIVFAGGSLNVKRSVDGGVTWNTVLTASGLWVNEILINPANPQIIMVAAEAGLYRSTDGGTTFTQLYTQRCFDLKLKPGNNNTVYLVKDNPALEICQFFISTDRGATWTLQTTGWYQSSDPDRSNGGARIGVTPADTNRVYAYLIGESKANDFGFIGVYMSTTGGTTWTLPNGPPGGPYTATHPNLAIGFPAWTYHQGFYNCGIAVSPTDPDKILVGGLNLWRSNDGAQTYTPVAGYVGGNLSMHVDMQDLRSVGNATWVTTDGGIYASTDFFANNATPVNAGIRGADYWGFGSGWNRDILVGGLYHNGNLAYHENYGLGNFLSLGGGEAPTGYVNPGNNRKTYYSDIGGVVVPNSLGGAIGTFSIGLSPNESYFSAESSEMEFDPRCYNTVYLGNENKLWKSTDGGGSYTLVKAFGSNANNQVKYIEIARSHPQVMYVSQQFQSGGPGTLWKTTDGGANWAAVALPPGNSRRMLISVDMTDHNTLWLAYPDGSNGSKVFRSTNGGLAWTNLTTAVLNNEYANALVAIPHTNGGVYFCSQRTVFYRNNALTDWQIIADDLPAYFNANIARPFYRDGKIRIASYGKGIWESMLYDQPAQPVAQIMVDQLQQTAICEVDSFRFEDYSVLNHSNATWQWSFPGGVPASSTVRNPVVYYANPGTYQAVLTVTDGNNQTDSDTLTVTVQAIALPTALQEDFEASFPPYGTTLANPDNGAAWQQCLVAGGYGSSNNSAYFRNYVYDVQGAWDDLRFHVDLTAPLNGALTFDVAHAVYGGQYTDTLEVLASTDCGATFTRLYKKWGADLATAPNNTNEFFPTAAEWRTDTVDLSAYGSQPHVVVAFRNIGAWGNNVFIDNIQLQTSGMSTAEPQEERFGVFPNPVSAKGMLNIGHTGRDPLEVKLFNSNAQVVLKTTVSANAVLDLKQANLPAGVYVLHIKGAQRMENHRLVVY